MNVEYYRQQIAEENPEAVAHDMELVNQATQLSFYDEGWEALKDECITEAARKAIDRIEIRKYRAREAHYNME